MAYKLYLPQKMNLFKKSIVSAIILLSFQGCYYDNEEQLYPATGCNLTNVTLASKVKPILQARCYSCHAQNNYSTLGGNIDVETYSKLKVEVDNGRFLKSIKHEAGVSPMPKGSSQLIDPCDIKIIQEWIDLGALDN